MDPSKSTSAEGECHYNSEANAVFPSKEYLKRFVDPMSDPMKVHVQFLQAWHYFYKTYVNGVSNSLSLLEFGGGPALHSLISASEHVDSITFADYAESNRNEVITWKQRTDGCKCGTKVCAGHNSALGGGV